ncbi:hypothetical protein FOY91_14885 [Sphingomonas solaris]|uniref:Cell envelope biogenesis protein TolA n=1 Tax=Alterirhizorhabdus solaris TaxID=2529389 RepID=A0A558QZ25_9SPHN|nr:hypothetical protein FOY91_14885 [Sphingomonas solaris]
MPKPAVKPTPKPTPAKPTPAKAAPAKPTKETSAKSATASPAKPSKADIAATGDTRDRRRPDRTEGGGAPSTRPAKPAGGAPGDKPAKAAGSRLGADFLKGITPEKTSPGKSTKPAAAAVSASAMQGLAGAIKRQVQPCYELGSLAGTPAMSIVTTLRLRFNKDGTIANAPSVAEHSGVTPGNQAYVRQIDDVARRAVLRCAPLKLPAELYDGGWEDIELRFTPGTMG